MTTIKQPGESRALIRGLSILSEFSHSEQRVTQTALAQRLDLPLPTVGRLCRTLISAGYLEHVEGSRELQIGPEARRLAGTGTSNAAASIRRWTSALNSRFNEVINVGVLDHTQVLYVDSVASRNQLQVQTQIGSRSPAHCTAMGKALLAALDEQVAHDRLGPGPYERYTQNTILTWDDMQRELERIRGGQISVTNEEFEIGLSGFAVAVPRIREDDAQLAVSVAVPTARLSTERSEEIISALKSGPPLYDTGAEPRE